MADVLVPALKALRGEGAEEVERGIRLLQDRLTSLPEAEFHQGLEALCALFYVDTHDRPDLERCLERALDVLVALGARAVPPLLQLMQGSDIKSHTYLARTLGGIGAVALPALRHVVAVDDDPYSRAFALYALGKVRDPGVREALPEILGSLMHPDKEVRDSAARSLGKIAEVVPADLVSEARRDEMFEALFRALSDFQAAVRAKAIRSLGKLVRAGYLTPRQVDRVRLAARRMLGEDEQNEWDRAYVVRREAEEALRLSGLPPGSGSGSQS